MEQLPASGSDSIPPLPPDTKPLEHQIACHIYGRAQSKYGPLEQKSSGFVLKPFISPPCGPREHRFYVDVFSKDSSSELRSVRRFVPTFFGTYEFAGMQYLVLEKTVKKFRRPCVADIKIGQVTYDSEATAEKIQRLTKKYTPAIDTGFQLLGWKTYRRSQKSFIYHDKLCTRSLGKHELSNALANFFGAPDIDHRPVVPDVIENLHALEHVIDSLHSLSFIGTSFLIVYEGEQNQDNTQSELKVEVRLVDFAHAFRINDQDGKLSDKSNENFLFGLRSYIKYLEIILDDNFVYTPLEQLNHDQSTNTASACYTMRI